MSNYLLGDVVRLTASWTDGDGTPVDPTEVHLQLFQPDGAVVSYEYGVGTQLKRVQAGVYYVDIILTVEGQWRYRWYSQGEGQASFEGSLFCGSQSAVTAEMSEAVIRRFTHATFTSLRVLGRFRRAYGGWAKRATTAQIQARIKAVGEEATFESTLLAADVLYDQLIAGDPAWGGYGNDRRHQFGYNFAWTIPPAMFPIAGWYTIEVLLVDSDGQASKLIWEGPVRNTGLIPGD